VEQLQLVALFIVERVRPPISGHWWDNFLFFFMGANHYCSSDLVPGNACFVIGLLAETLLKAAALAGACKHYSSVDIPVDLYPLSHMHMVQHTNVVLQLH
jgi:hypothetical protein